MKNALKWITSGVLGAGLLLIGGCTHAPEVFQHDLSPPPSPWVGRTIENTGDKFTFALFTDLNGGEREGIFNVAAVQLALLKPDFIVSVGDLIDGYTEDKTRLEEQWDSFDKRAEKAGAPIFRVGGNHDLSNVAMRERWAERYGPRYYHFLYRDVLFLVLDSEDFSETMIQQIYQADDETYEAMIETRVGEIGAEQSQYFEQVLAANPDVKWTFLFMHKPTWLREDGRGLTRVETALGERPYTVFNGHFHNLLHTTRNGMDYIMLGTTGGSQNPLKANAFDHLTLVTMDTSGPTISHIRMDGLLDKTGNIPENGNGLCFQNSKCGEETQ